MCYSWYKLLCSNELLLLCAFFRFVVGNNRELIPTRTHNGTILRLTYSDAKRHCEQSIDHQHLPFDIDENYDKASSVMSDYNLTELWMPFRKQDFGKWKNVNGTENLYFKGYDSSRDGQLIECAVLDRRTGKVAVDNCEAKGKGYICRTECKHCPMLVTSYNCLRENGACYIIECDAGNWFGARDICRNMNGSLVTADNENSAQGIKKVIGTLGIRSCDSFWLGTRHSDWFIDRGKDVGRTLLYRSLWYDDQPESVGTKSCAYLSKFFKGIYLYSSACDAEYPFFCERAKNMPTADESLIVTRQPFSDFNNTESISTKRTVCPNDANEYDDIRKWRISCIVLGILCTLFAGFMCILAKRHVNRRRQNAEHYKEEARPMTGVAV